MDLVHAHDWLIVRSNIRWRDEHSNEFVIDYYRCECGAGGKVVTPKAEYDKGNKKLDIEEYETEEKKQSKAVEEFAMRNLQDIIKARAEAIKAGGHPRTLYIGDIFPGEPEQLFVSPMNVDTGCVILGMRIVADFRIPRNKFYITYGDLSYGGAKNES